MLDLNYKKYGTEGANILILHGLFGMLDNWQTFAKKIALAGYQVYAIDQRNHGRSPSTDDFNYVLLAEDLKDFCEQHKIENVHLIGHSMGGKSCMKLSLTHPYLVASQTIVDIAPKTYKGNHETIFKALFSLNLDKIEDRKEASKKLSTYIHEEGVIQFLLKNLERKKEGGYRFKMNLESLYNNYQSILDSIIDTDELSYIPSLFVRGGKSNYILDGDIDLIDQIFPNNQLSTIEDSGHWIHAEKPMELLELITDFID